MSQAWNEWDLDYPLHFLGGLGINAAVAGLVAWLEGPPWVPVPVAVVICLCGIIREEFQHNWSWLTAHQWLEGALWGVGALVAALVGLAFA